VSLAKDYPVSMSEMRVRCVDVNPVEIEVDKDIGYRERATDVTGAGVEDGTEDKLARSGGKLVEFTDRAVGR
jgi:hypothetical protein